MRSRRWLARHPLFLLHVGVVVAFELLLVWAATAVGNIAAGFAMVPVAALGLPWSLLYFSPLAPDNPTGSWPPPLWFSAISVVMIYVPAWLNVALHYGALRQTDRRRPRRLTAEV